MLVKKGTHQSENYQALTAHIKINRIPFAIFQATSLSFPLIFASPFSIMTQSSFEFF